MKKAKPVKKVSQPAQIPSSSTRIALGLLWVRKGLIALILFALPVLIYLGNTEYGYTKSIFALVAVSCLVVIWFAEMWVRRSYTVRLTQLFWPGVALVAAGALSFIHTQSFNVSLQSLNLMLYFGLFYFILAHSIENERDVKLFLGCLLAAAVPSAIYGLLQYYDRLAGAPGFPGGQEAIISFMGNKNYLGGFLAYLFPPAIIMLVLARSRLVPGAVIAALALSSYALVVIDSKSVWLSLAVGFVFLAVSAFAVGLFRAIPPRQKRWAVAAFAVVALAATAFIARDMIAAGQGANPFVKIGNYFSSLWEAHSGETRAWDWWIGYEMWKDSPVIGQGIGNYKLKFLEYKAKFRETPQGQAFDFYIPRAVQAHNEYVQVAAEMGIVGIIAVLGLLGTLFGTSLRQAARTPVPQEKWILLAALAGVVAFMVDSTFSFPLHLPASALDFVFLLGLLQSKWLRRDLPSVKLSLRANRPLAMALSVAVGAVVVIFVGFVVILAGRDWVADTCLDTGQTDLNGRVGRPPVLDVARAELEDCSLAYDFQPSEVLFQLGKLYDQKAKQTADSKPTPQSAAEMDEYVHKSLDYYERSLEVFPTYEAYLQVALLNFQLGSGAKESGGGAETKKYFQEAGDKLNELLKLKPDEMIEREARFTLDVLLPFARDGVQEGLTRVNHFLEQFPDFERAYITRAEIYRALSSGSENSCQRARADYEKALEIIKEQTNTAQARIDEIHLHGQQKPDEIQRLLNQLQIGQYEEEKIKEELKGLKC